MLENKVFYVPIILSYGLTRLVRRGRNTWAVEKNKRNKPNHIKSVRTAQKQRSRLLWALMLERHSTAMVTTSEN